MTYEELMAVEPSQLMFEHSDSYGRFLLMYVGLTAEQADAVIRQTRYNFGLNDPPGEW